MHFHVAFAFFLVNTSKPRTLGFHVSHLGLPNVLSCSEIRSPSWFPVLCLMNLPTMHKWRQDDSISKSQAHLLWNLVSEDEALTRLPLTSVPPTGIMNNNNGQKAVSAEERMALM